MPHLSKLGASAALRKADEGLLCKLVHVSTTKVVCVKSQAPMCAVQELQGEPHLLVRSQGSENPPVAEQSHEGLGVIEVEPQLPQCE